MTSRAAMSIGTSKALWTLSARSSTRPYSTAHLSGLPRWSGHGQAAGWDSNPRSRSGGLAVFKAASCRLQMHGFARYARHPARHSALDAERADLKPERRWIAVQTHAGIARESREASSQGGLSL